MWFGSESACRAYIRQLRWPQGFVCPACGVTDDPSEMSRGLLLCRSCGRQVSLTAGTIFQDTHKPLRLWFLTMWFITSQKNGVANMKSHWYQMPEAPLVKHFEATVTA